MKLEPKVSQASYLVNENTIGVNLNAVGSIHNTNKKVTRIYPIWADTYLVFDDEGISYEIVGTPLEYQSKHQHIEIFKSKNFGDTLWLNGVLMSSAYDQRLYHECSILPAASLCQFLDDILILGVGPGGMLPIVLPWAKKITAVDIDEELVYQCKTHLPEWSDDAFNNEKVTLIIDDAVKVVRSLNKCYDLIICDFHVGADKFPESFIQDLSKLLGHRGTLVSHYGPAGLTGVANTQKAYHRLCSIGKPKIWQHFIPSFGDMWGWVAVKKNTVYRNIFHHNYDHVKYFTQDDIIRMCFDSYLPKYLDYRG
jgi:spermidine synthase